jgi:hypothetical protein
MIDAAAGFRRSSSPSRRCRWLPEGEARRFSGRGALTFRGDQRRAELAEPLTAPGKVEGGIDPMTDEEDLSGSGGGQDRSELEDLAQHIVEPILDREEVERAWLLRAYEEGVPVSVWVQIRGGDERAAPEIDAFLRKRLDEHRHRREASQIEIAVMLTTGPGQLRAYRGTGSREDAIVAVDLRSHDDPSIATPDTMHPPLEVQGKPWAMTREGATLHVSIAGPVEGSDWDELLDGILDQLEAGVHAVTLPAQVGGMSSVGQAMLEALWGVLVARGVVVQRASDAPPA